MRTNPELRGYDGKQRQRFLALWARSGDPRTLADTMAAHPAWQADGWRAWAKAEHDLDDLPAACGILAAHAPKPGLPPEPAGGEKASRAELEQAAAGGAGNPLFALRLFRARQANGDPGGALAALRPITARKDGPLYFHYLEAMTAGEAGQWQEAWQAWERYEDALREQEKGG